MEKKLSVHLEDGMDARAIAQAVQTANNYESSLHLLVRNISVNLKSIMGMMALQLAEGDEITLVAEGADESAAISGLEGCFRKA